MSRCNSNKDCDEKKGLKCIVNECKCNPGKFYEYNVAPNKAKCRNIVIYNFFLKISFLFLENYLEVNELCLANFQCNIQKGLICVDGLCTAKKTFTKF